MRREEIYKYKGDKSSERKEATKLGERTKGPFHEFVERGERGRAMHAGGVLCAQSSLVRVCADRPTPRTPRSCCAVIRESAKKAKVPYKFQARRAQTWHGGSHHFPSQD